MLHVIQLTFHSLSNFATPANCERYSFVFCLKMITSNSDTIVELGHESILPVLRLIRLILESDGRVGDNSASLISELLELISRIVHNYYQSVVRSDEGALCVLWASFTSLAAVLSIPLTSYKGQPWKGTHLAAIPRLQGGEHTEIVTDLKHPCNRCHARTSEETRQPPFPDMAELGPET